MLELRARLDAGGRKLVLLLATLDVMQGAVARSDHHALLVAL
jgi:hypothetical protein